jgi:hypothetical protein
MPVSSEEQARITEAKETLDSEYNGCPVISYTGRTKSHIHLELELVVSGNVNISPHRESQSRWKNGLNGSKIAVEFEFWVPYFSGTRGS